LKGRRRLHRIERGRLGDIKEYLDEVYEDYTVLTPEFAADLMGRRVADMYFSR